MLQHIGYRTCKVVTVGHISSCSSLNFFNMINLDSNMRIQTAETCSYFGITSASYEICSHGICCFGPENVVRVMIGH